MPDVPPFQSIDMSSVDGYRKLLELRDSINAELKRKFDEHVDHGPEYMASVLPQLVEDLAEGLSEYGYHLSRTDYDGCTPFTSSGQQWTTDGFNGGVTLDFLGYSVQVSWWKSDV